MQICHGLFWALSEPFAACSRLVYGLKFSNAKLIFIRPVLSYFAVATATWQHWRQGAAGLSCTELSICEFPFLRGFCWQGWNSIWYCVNGMPQKDTLDNVTYTCMLSILSTSFTSVSIFSVCCYSSVSISVLSAVVFPCWRRLTTVPHYPLLAIYELLDSMTCLACWWEWTCFSRCSTPTTSRTRSCWDSRCGQPSPPHSSGIIWK